MTELLMAGLENPDIDRIDTMQNSYATCTITGTVSIGFDGFEIR